ncbi:hypothetical protein IG631_09862 [Alternaria alternata]|nr:hypothetical protein IG631_09862 [Alternaria alternata]
MAGQAESLERDHYLIDARHPHFQTLCGTTTQDGDEIGKTVVNLNRLTAEARAVREYEKAQTDVLQVPPARMRITYDFRSGPTC